MANLMCGSSLQQGRMWLLIACIILLVATVRPMRPLDKGEQKASVLFTKDQMEIKQTLVKNLEKEQPKAGTECDNNEEEEECLDRRTLSAHTDYIYTQQHNNP